MQTIRELFGTSKPIIALLHLRELPGDPGYVRGDRIEHQTELARKELLALQEGGVDAILFSNEFSYPYMDELSHVTTASMAYIIGRLKEEIRIPFGVHAISDPMATIELAAAVDAQFVRSVFAGGYVGESGIRSKNAGGYVRRKMELGLDDLMMFYMINAESDGDLSGRELEVIAKATVFKCHPEGICMSGIHAGLEADTDDLRRIRAAVPGTPVFSNTGTRKENVADKLAACDGAFVGTAFKKNGEFLNFVDGELVKEFMETVRRHRKDQ
ncbi:MAG: BtpA/SgcQ family protein [Lachnospiraceae bacterium]|nr:BtpA/SgcQ family protein [Lachnospiraceae bacterium]